MATNKTTETNISVADFVNQVENDTRRNDSLKLIEIFKAVTGFEPKLWGPTIIGFGSYHYRYDSGHSGDAPLAAFSPRKDSLVLYFSSHFEDREALLSRLGKHKPAKACVYVKKLEDIDTNVLQTMIRSSVESILKIYPQ